MCFSVLLVATALHHAQNVRLPQRGGRKKGEERQVAGEVSGVDGGDCTFCRRARHGWQAFETREMPILAGCKKGDREHDCKAVYGAAARDAGCCRRHRPILTRGPSLEGAGPCDHSRRLPRAFPSRRTARQRHV